MALFLPWAVGKAVLSRRTGADWWVPDLWAQTPPALAIPRSLEVFGLGPQAGLLPIQLKQYSTLKAWLVVALFVPLLMLWVVSVLGTPIYLVGSSAKRCGSIRRSCSSRRRGVSRPAGS